jgi:hypothetical protein
MPLGKMHPLLATAKHDGKDVQIIARSAGGRDRPPRYDVKELATKKTIFDVTEGQLTDVISPPDHVINSVIRLKGETLVRA